MTVLERNYLNIKVWWWVHFSFKYISSMFNQYMGKMLWVDVENAIKLVVIQLLFHLHNSICSVLSNSLLYNKGSAFFT